MKLKSKEIKREKSKRTFETRKISLERIASGVVEESSAYLFKVRFSRKTLKEEYNLPKSEEELFEENYTPQNKRILLFRKQDAEPGTYKKPEEGNKERCIYRGNKKDLFPYAIYDMNWNLLFREK